MKTFIDEAGIFIDPQYTNTHKISVVGALVIPDSSYIAVCDFFVELKRQWGFTGEVKGSQLTEIQVNSLLESLQKYNVLFDAVIVDSKFFSPTIIANHKTHFAKKILANVSPYHHPNVVRQIKTLSSTISEISDQLYIQNLAMTSIIHRSHQLATLFYVQRIPSELGQFEWVIDAKQKSLTKSEKWWTDILKPNLQGMSMINPMIMLEGADYSYYHQFDDVERPGFGTINKIIKDIKFCDSVAEEGIQLADILTTSLRKALNQKFKVEGWRGIGRLMIHMRGNNLLAIILEGAIPTLQSVPYYYVLDTLNKEARPMIL